MQTSDNSIHPKVAGATAGAAAASILIWALSLVNVNVPASVAVDVVTLAAFVAGYLSPRA